jgi:two-component system sensor histidine kinase SenX3
VDATALNLIFALMGAVLGAIPVLAWRISEREMRTQKETPSYAEAAVVPPGVSTVLSVLRSSALVVDEDDRVLQASAPAYAMGLVHGAEVRVPALGDIVRQVRRDGETRVVDLEIENARSARQVHARVAALSSRLILVLADDRTRERQVEAIRRDFVANVSHELKTPIGALTLLAEAVQEASDDPDAVQHFSNRMKIEAGRLGRLVQQIIELSRLQDDQALDSPHVVDVDTLIASCIDAVEVEAKTKDIEVVYDGQHGLRVLGNREQISLALGNLVANAVAYSEQQSQVTLSAHRSGTMVDLAVSDEGIGIPADELERIFERFYRVDPARHRSTGGTGLGLSIVKHVAAAHGGEVKVWSRPGHGSTFTLRLPRAHDVGAPSDAGRAASEASGQSRPLSTPKENP